jgi:hypothetical protein
VRVRDSYDAFVSIDRLAWRAACCKLQKLVLNNALSEHTFLGPQTVCCRCGSRGNRWPLCSWFVLCEHSLSISIQQQASSLFLSLDVGGQAEHSTFRQPSEHTSTAECARWGENSYGGDATMRLVQVDSLVYQSGLFVGKQAYKERLASRQGQSTLHHCCTSSYDFCRSNEECVLTISLLSKVGRIFTFLSFRVTEWFPDLI